MWHQVEIISSIQITDARSIKQVQIKCQQSRGLSTSNYGKWLAFEIHFTPMNKYWLQGTNNGIAINFFGKSDGEQRIQTNTMIPQKKSFLLKAFERWSRCYGLKVVSCQNVTIAQGCVGR